MWHVSISGPGIQDGPAYREAHLILDGVGNETEWWMVNRRSQFGVVVAHLRLGVTAEEYAKMPKLCALADAGNAGTAGKRGLRFRRTHLSARATASAASHPEPGTDSA